MRHERIRPNVTRPLLLVLWFLFLASAMRWVPAYEGDLDRSETTFVPVYAVIAVLAAITVHEVAPSVRAALVSALPAMAIIAGIAACGLLLNVRGEEVRGGPLYLYLGVAVWVSWVALMLLAALMARTKWNGLAGISVGSVVAILGLLLFTAQVD